MARDTDDEAPWLAAAEPPVRTRRPADAGPRTEVSRRSLFWVVVVLLTLAAIAAIALIIAFTRREGGSTAGYMNAEQAPLIAAEPGPYKVPPTDPQGLRVEGQDQTIYAAGEGLDPGSVIDGNSVPEEPLPRPGLPRDLVPEGANDVPAAGATNPPPTVTPPAPAVTVRPAPPPAGAPRPPTATVPPAATPKPAAVAPGAKPIPAAPAAKPTGAAPVGKPGTVQLGAFSSEDKANAAWAALAGKPGIAGFAKRIIKVEADGKTLYRLRASGGDAAAACARLQAAGQACTVVE